MSFEEFPHRCKVTDFKVNADLPPSQQVPVPTVILETRCDIQAAGKPTEASYAIDADYVVYIPVMQMPLIQKGTRIELFYTDEDIRTGTIKQCEPGMMLGNRIWVKEIAN